jgi:hypothetical protein
MLRVRDEQMKVFEKVALRNFEDEMVQHLKQFTPRHSEIIAEQGVRRVVEIGIERAKGYGLTNRGPMRFYIELMFMLGNDFDTDPQYPWAGEILNHPENADQMERADSLYNKMMEYIQRVAGFENRYEKEALRRVIQMRFEDFAISAENFKPEILMHLNRICPQKCKYIGELAINALLKRGRELAEIHVISSAAVPALFVGLMFIFGHNCFTDPHPWIAGTLSNASVADTNKRIERPFSKTMTYLSSALSLMEKR